MTRQFIPGLEVIIMCHHRQDETLRAIKAIQAIDFGVDTYIRVSDNPSEPEKAIHSIPAGVTYTRRNPPIPSGLLHMNKIFSEVRYEWTLLTHDDDELLPELGHVFRKHRMDHNVSVITGKSRIIADGVETTDVSYENRLSSANLNHSSDQVRFDLAKSLVDIGPLFPASAIITRSEIISKISMLNPDWALAGDLGHSIVVSQESGVIFEGAKFVMNYHIHGDNSVFSVAAAGGLMSDFTITRLDYFTKNLGALTRKNEIQLAKGILISRILAKSFHLNDRYKKVKIYALHLNLTFSKRLIRRAVLLPIPLGPVKVIIRRLMWKRLGVKRWGY